MLSARYADLMVISKPAGGFPFAPGFNINYRTVES